MPENFEGVQFCAELEAAGVKINRNTSPLIDAERLFWLDIAAKDQDKAQAVLDAHIPKPQAEPTIEEKLASVGLTIPDLKTALGI